MTTEKKHPELQALQGVHQALLPLEPEARLRVMRAVGALLQTQEAGGTTTSHLELGGSQGPGIVPTMEIATFVSAKRPTDTYQKLACLAYYLEDHDNKIDLSRKDLTKANGDARQMRISNIGTFLDLATRRHGYFTSIGRGKKRLSTRGAAVVQALPDQAAVKAALQQHPLPKKGGRKAQKKPGNHK